MRPLTVAVTVVVVVVALTGKVCSGFIFDFNVEEHLEKFATSRYPNSANEQTREDVRKYIVDRFKYYGLDVQEQKFNTTVQEKPTGFNSDNIQVQGTNIIGIVPAVTQHPGAVVVVGADYDSNGVSDPMFRNGAGVAALLAAAHAYGVNEAWSGRYVANYTTIFVAFDINTKLHMGSPGIPGGHYFVKEWLWPYIERNATYFGGAVILDSIFNVDYEENTQFFSNEFKNMFPDTYERIRNDGEKGNFLSMVSIDDKKETVDLRDQFAGSYNRNRKGRRFRLENMELKTGMAFDDNFVLEVVKCENTHFWTFKDDVNKTVMLPAILLTDTVTLRSTPHCASTACRPKDLITEDRIEFVNATVEALTHFLFSRQATLLPEVPSAASSLQSALMTVAMLCLVRLYM